jgi:chemotaxis protein histidine kinase CheA
MRRRKHSLQVSLFPFLAVLLCTLGALILLLLVLDNRARQQVEAEAAQAAEESARQAAEIRQHLQDLEEQEKEAQAQKQREKQEQVRSLEHQLENTAVEEERQQAQLAGLHALVQAEQGRIQQVEQQIQERQHQAAQVEAEKKRSVSRLGALHEQIRLLERTVERLRAAAAERQQRQPLYSLVPYQGRQGTRRQPIYLECVSEQVKLHPEGTLFPVKQVEAKQAFRTALERQIEAVQQRSNERPYLLLLVRPSGIMTYYEVVGSLQGLALDVGYEFLQEDWVLDLTDSGTDPPAQPRTAPLEEGTNLFRNAVTGTGRGPVPAAPAGAAPKAVSLGGGSLLDGKGSMTGQGGEAPRPGPVAAESPSSPRTSPSTDPLTLPSIRKPPNALALNEQPPGEKPGSAQPVIPDVPHLRGEGNRPEGQAAPAGFPASSTSSPGQGRRGSGDGKGLRPAAGGTRALHREENRDWVLLIECRAEGIVVHPHKTRIGPEHLTGANLDNNLLLQTVRQVLEAQLKHHPNLRPRLKYAIRPDGLRNYYLASAFLESLKLPFDTEIVDDAANLETLESPGGLP